MFKLRQNISARNETRMKTTRVLPFLALLCIQSIQAAVVFVGVENGNGPTYTAQRWTDPLTPKTYATVGSIYGTSGYYDLAPLPDGPGAIYAAGTGNDITQQGTLFSKPTGLSANPSIINGTWVNFPGYAITLNPSNTDTARIGAMSAGLTTPGGAFGYFNDFMTVPVDAGQSYRMGVMVDALGEAIYGAQAVSIYDSSSGIVTYSTSLTEDGVPELVFFDIKNTSGATVNYSVALHSNVVQTSGFSLVTFDPVPEPSTWALLGVGAWVCLVRRRRLA
jgi:hypothetical protein